jgi:uncharacterized Zn finger protein (UPF0148 family)
MKIGIAKDLGHLVIESTITRKGTHMEARACADCGAPLPRPRGRGRPPVRCATCRKVKAAPKPMPEALPTYAEVDLLASPG